MKLTMLALARACRGTGLAMAGAVALVLLVLPVAACATSTDALIKQHAERSGVPLTSDEHEVLERAMPILRQRYLYDVSEDEVLQKVFDALQREDIGESGDDAAVADGGAESGPLARIALGLNSALHELDAHTAYMTPDDYREMEVRTKGEFGGLGLEVTMADGLVKVVSPIDDTPAAGAGMQAGDLISHVDGVAVKGMTLRQAVMRMRGPVGSDIHLTVLREGQTAPLDVRITRDIIRIRPVRHRVEGDVGYVRISTFSRRADTELRAAIEEIEGELGDRLRGIVVDLRNNPGGLLDQAIKVADTFLDRGDIVSVRGRSLVEEARYEAEYGDVARGTEIVVLINAGSASASEIVAGALKDHHRATLIGNRSFGKGSVQTIMPMGRYGAMRLTTQLYYMPSGITIQALGVYPDLKVAIDSDEPAPAEGKIRREENLDNAIRRQVEQAASSNEVPTVSGQRCQSLLQRKVEDQMLACALAFLGVGGIEQLAAAAAVPVLPEAK